MKEEELQLVTNHIKHSLNVHIDVGKTLQDPSEFSKLSILLVAVEKGLLRKSRKELNLNQALELIRKESILENDGKIYHCIMIFFLTLLCYNCCVKQQCRYANRTA